MLMEGSSFWWALPLQPTSPSLPPLQGWEYSMQPDEGEIFHIVFVPCWRVGSSEWWEVTDANCEWQWGLVVVEEGEYFFWKGVELLLGSDRQRREGSLLSIVIVSQDRITIEHQLLDCFMVMFVSQQWKGNINAHLSQWWSLRILCSRGGGLGEK